MKNRNKFIVPADDQKDFDRMVQRANRRIKASLKYIQQEEIQDRNTQRALVGDYSDASNWATPKTIFSRSKSFESKKAYEQYKRHVLQWGDIKNHRSIDEVKEGYYKAIIRSLDRLAQEANAPIHYKNGRLPVQITRAVKSMTLEQMTHYFDEGDASEDLDYLYYKWEDFAGIESREEFISVALSHINTVKQVYGHSKGNKLNQLPKGKPKKKRKKRRKSRKKRK